MKLAFYYKKTYSPVYLFPLEQFNSVLKSKIAHCVGAISVSTLNFLGYHASQDYLLGQCEVYRGPTRKVVSQMDHPITDYRTHCLYVKTHEPWFPSNIKKSYYKTATRAALILRHPFDSALAEKKRLEPFLTALNFW